MTYPNVRVYTKPRCVQCDATKRWLNSRSIEYDVVDVTQSPDDFDALIELGYKQMPVVAVGDDTHWSGFNPNLLAEYLEEGK